MALETKKIYKLNDVGKKCSYNLGSLSYGRDSLLRGLCGHGLGSILCVSFFFLCEVDMGTIIVTSLATSNGSAETVVYILEIVFHDEQLSKSFKSVGIY